MKKRLTRSYTDKKLLGVFSGIGEYFRVEPTIIRLIWTLMTFFGFSLLLLSGHLFYSSFIIFLGLLLFVGGILTYIFAAIIMPTSLR